MSNLSKRVASNLDDLLNSKPPEEIEEDKVKELKKSEPLSREVVTQEIKEPEISKHQSKLPKGEKIPVATYFQSGDYDDFEEIRDSLQKAVRRETKIKLKEATVVEYAVLLMLEDYRKNPQRVIERFSKLAKKMKWK